MASRFFLLFILTFSNFLFSKNEMDDHPLSQLSLREKIGQLCFIAAAIDETADPELMKGWHEWQPLYRIDRQYTEQMIKQCKIGGIVFYGKYAQPAEELALTQYYQSISKIPLLITLDAEVGLTSRLNSESSMRFPYNMTLGAMQDNELIYQAAYEVGRQLKLLGVHVNFAPVVDVNNNPANPVIGMRSFGSDKERVAVAGIAYMRGLQDAGIIACAKHFPGHGDTSVDSHLFLPLIGHSLEHLRSNELYPFKKLIDAGVKSVMTAHLEIPALEKEAGLPSSLSKAVVTGLLQEQMGFKGLIFSDALGMKGVADRFEPGEVELRTLQAGNDVLLCPLDVVKAIDRIEKAVLNGEISESEIDRKVLKVLDAKKWALANSQIVNPLNLQQAINTESAKHLLQQLFLKAVTCVKCEPNFPKSLSKEKVAVIGLDPSLNIFVDFLKKNLDVLDESGIQEASHVVLAVFSKTGSEGEVSKMRLKNKIRELKTSNKKVTVVLFSSPYLLPVISEADNVIVAYEPERGAQIAAAEVMSCLFKPEGILPVKLEVSP